MSKNYILRYLRNGSYPLKKNKPALKKINGKEILDLETRLLHYELCWTAEGARPLSRGGSWRRGHTCPCTELRGREKSGEMGA